MDIEEIISSGMLELYVMGSLSQREAERVEEVLHEYPDVKAEIEKIEATLMQIGVENVTLSETVWQNITAQLQKSKKPQKIKKPIGFRELSGWAAAIFCLLGVYWFWNENKSNYQQLQIIENEKIVLEEEILDLQSEVDESIELLTMLRSKEVKTVLLPANERVTKTAYAKVFYNTSEGTLYLDIQGLPKAPEGKVYQAWSLLLDPLIPTSIGVLDSTKDTIIKLDNIPTSEAFGITLEDEGGSETPSLDQLYVLGVVNP